MHEGVWLTVLGCLTNDDFGSGVAIIEKIKMPYTVLLALLGIIIGLADNG